MLSLYVTLLRATSCWVYLCNLRYTQFPTLGSGIIGAPFWNNSQSCTFSTLLYYCLSHLSVHEWWVSSHCLPSLIFSAWRLSQHSLPLLLLNHPILQLSSIVCIVISVWSPYPLFLLSSLMFRANPFLQSPEGKTSHSLSFSDSSNWK